MSKIIIAREAYDWITEEQVSRKDFYELISFIEKNYPGKMVIEQRHKRLRFINYIGVVQCSNVRFEIIPKISLTNNKDDDLHALLSMLYVTDFLPITIHDKLQSGKGKGSLLSVFINAFIKRLHDELKRGLYKTYERVESNLPVIKGKLVISRHIRENMFHKTKAYCEYDEHTENNLLNQLLKAALLIVLPHINTRALQLKLERCLAYFNEVDSVHITQSMIDSIAFNRQNDRFRDVVQFAKIILQRASFYQQGKQSTSFAFLFPMNELFEKYIEVALFRAFGRSNVHSQHRQKRLLRNTVSGRKNILLNPDFVINNEVIIDTKWKSGTRYDQADIYQMYAYVNAYRNVNRAILLYPMQEGDHDYPTWEVIENKKIIEMHPVRVDDFWVTVGELQELLEVKSDGNMVPG